MRYFKGLLFSILIVFFLPQCKKEVNPGTQPTLEEMARDEFYKVMKDWYLWYDKMPMVDVAQYSTASDLLEALRYQPLDKWSYITTLEQFTSYFEEGTYEGHGFGFTFDDEGKAWITFVFKTSDLYPQGVRRGWQILQINSTDVNPQIDISNLMVGTTIGSVDRFTFLKPDSSIIELSSTRKLIKMNTVLESDTLHVGSKIVGHLVFKSFLQPSLAELDTVFEFFHTVGATDLILDLRYNSGGRMDVAGKLAGFIAGTANAGKPFLKYEHNDKRTSYNSEVTFPDETNALSLSQVVVIASKGTASASEALINGLKPYMKVVQIGDSTYGKPVGMHTWTYADEYAFVPISFKILNVDGVGDYFAGLPPNSYVIDGVSKAFSDKNEPELKEAIQYLATGVFSNTAPLKSLKPASKKKFGMKWIIGAY